MKINKKLIIYIIFISIISIALGFCMGQTPTGDKINNLFEKNYKPSQVPNSELEILDNCKNLDLKNTAYCWRDNIDTFFYYEYHSDILIEDFEELKETGGDCTEWSYLYGRLADKSSISNKKIIVEGIKGVQVGHIYLMIWDEDFKCKLDQLSVECEKR